MNCFDCAAMEAVPPLWPYAADCGAGLCPDHAHVEAHWLTRMAVINRTVVVSPRHE